MKSFSNVKQFLTIFWLTAFVFVFQLNGFSQQNKVDSLRKVLKSHPRDLKVTGQLYDALKKTNKDSLSRFINKLLIEGEEKNDSLLIAEAYNFKGSLTSDNGDGTSALVFYKKSLAYSANKKDSLYQSLSASVNRNIANSLEKFGKDKEAEPYYIISIEQFGKIKDSLGMANTYLYYGQTLKDMGNYEKANLLLFQGLGIAERKKDDKLTGRLMNNIANVYNGMGKYDDAISFYQQSIEYKKKSGQTGEIGNTYGNIGVTYYTMHKFDLALEYYRKALPLKEQIGDKRGVASTTNNIGLAYFEMGQCDSAEVYLLRAQKMRVDLGDELGMASSNAAIGNLYIRTKRCAKAIPYLQNAITLAEKNGALEILQRSYLYSSYAYDSLGRYKEAFEASKKYISITDSMIKTENLRQSEEMKAKYDAVKQDEQIKDLQNQKRTEEMQHAADAERRMYFLIGGSIIALLIILFLFIRYNENRKSRLVLQNAYNEIETKNKNITDSIRYARRIQQSILPDAAEFNRLFKNSFVFYKPKDIVSGDFWWIHETPGKQMVIAVADCTGHGVPGAFMSVMGTDILSQATKNVQIDNCAASLNFLDEGVRHQLRQTGGDDESRDGMDIAIALIDLKNKKVQFAGAIRPLVLVRDGKLIEYPGARFSIGGAFSGEKKFINHDMDVQSGDMVYLFTDGFSDQFGGPKGKKFKTSKLKELLVSIAHLPAEEQAAKLETAFNEWKGNLEQVDDICVAGIRI